uniref:VWFD domain-containing protein n=1 Tax=Alexandrium monilatum TaxID=311494 RepID=A0A7S4S9X2_9DINO
MLRPFMPVLLALALLPAASRAEDRTSEAGGTSTPEGASDGVVVQEVLRMQGMLESLQASLSEMLSCCNCSGGEGGGGHNKNGKGFVRPTTTRLNGPVSAGGAPTTTTITTTTSTARRAKEMTVLCAAFGDPHFITFDGGHTVFVGQRTIWLVKTESVWIQALAKGSDGKLLGLAVGGSFLRGHKLFVYNDTKNSHLEVKFDGKAILSQQVDKFLEPGIIDAQRDIEWDSTRHNDQILAMRTQAKFSVSSWKDRFMGTPKGGLLLLKLPEDVEITVTGVDFMSVVVTMPRPEGVRRQSGYCGNLNGDPEDDATPVVPSWNLPIGEDLGPVKSSLNLFKGKSTPKSLALTAALLEATEPEISRSPGTELHRLLDAVEHCPEALMKEAQRRCSSIQDARMERDCIFDICVTWDAGAAEDAAAAEALEEEVNAKGIPVFMGHGRCTDAVGRRFDAFETNVRTEKECQDVLRSLALTKGVLGAELHRTSSCRILVETGSDPTDAEIPGGWAGSEATEEPGRGLVSGIRREASWSCWQLD